MLEFPVYIRYRTEIFFMPFIDFNNRPKVQIWPGIEAALFHSDQTTMARVTINKGVEVPVHQHMHEQWTHVVEGELEFTLAGEKKTLYPGMSVYIPSNTPHAAIAREQTKVIDCFLPVRQDFVELEDKMLVEQTEPIK